MTEDTIFDLASLTKSLATATAFLQLYEQGQVRFDEPVQTYLPDFNPTEDPRRGQVTLRMLLTHTSGEPGDLSLEDPWGLDAADKARAFAVRSPRGCSPVPVRSSATPTSISFCSAPLSRRSPANPWMSTCSKNVFAPLGMEIPTTFPGQSVWPAPVRGNRVASAPRQPGAVTCPAGTWSTGLLARIAPTARDEEDRADPGMNPDFDYLLRGTVHDTTARRMGGVAGHAGVFSTAHDVSIYAQALLDRLAGRPSQFPLTQATLELMTTPQQPGHTARTTRSSERRYPRSHCQETEYRGSAARSELSGDQGAKPARLWLGYRFVPVAARHDLSYRELWPHRLYGNHAVDRPSLRYLRSSSLEFNPHARQSTHLEIWQVKWRRRQPRPWFFTSNASSATNPPGKDLVESRRRLLPHDKLKRKCPTAVTA